MHGRSVGLRFYLNEYKISEFERDRGSPLCLVRVKIKMSSDCFYIFLKEGALGQL